MKDFRSTIRATKSQIDAKAIVEGQTYFATDTGVFYRDYFNQRLTIGDLYKINTSDSNLPATLLDKIKSSILIQYDTSVPEYNLWYIDESGTPQSIGGSGGGVTYTAGDGINITGSVISVDDLEVLFKESAD
jgi:hypothetical protein